MNKKHIFFSLFPPEEVFFRCRSEVLICFNFSITNNRLVYFQTKQHTVYLQSVSCTLHFFTYTQIQSMYSIYTEESVSLMPRGSCQCCCSHQYPDASHVFVQRGTSMSFSKMSLFVLEARRCEIRPEQSKGG